MSNSIAAAYVIIIALVATKPIVSWAAPSSSARPPSAVDNCLVPMAENAEVESGVLPAPMEDSVAVRTYVKCLATDMGVWTDEAGFDAKEIAKLFAKQKMSDEILVVVNHCNESHRDENDLPKWAFDAYKCATSGRMGDWVKEHVTAVYGQKSIS